MKKSDIYGIIGTVLSCTILLLILILVVIPLSIPEQKNEEGIMVSFGETEDGGGKSVTPSENNIKESTTKTTISNQSTPKVKVTVQKSEEILTQNDNSFAINQQKKKEKQEKLALEKERMEEARAIAAENKKKQDAINKADAMIGGMGGMGNGSSTGSGSGTTNTPQGNPAGSGTSGGNSWSLGGRALTGRLASPSYDNDVEGKITVSIRVDDNGIVTNASISSPTTISDSDTRNAAIKAAKNTKFTKGNGIATGTITYNFKLR